MGEEDCSDWTHEFTPRRGRGLPYIFTVRATRTATNSIKATTIHSPTLLTPPLARTYRAAGTNQIPRRAARPFIARLRRGSGGPMRKAEGSPSRAWAL